MEEIKKYLLFLDSEKCKFEELNIGEDEKKEISNYFILEKNGMRNPKKLKYVELLKPINQHRTGSTKSYNKVIYFPISSKKIAKSIILNDFRRIHAGRTQESLSNLQFITEKNIEFVNTLLIPEKKEESIPEKKIKRKEK